MKWIKVKAQEFPFSTLVDNHLTAFKFDLLRAVNHLAPRQNRLWVLSFEQLYF